MADKMMRMGARGEDTLPKAIQATNEGILKSALATKKVYSGITAPANGEVVAIVLNTGIYTGFRLAATGSNSSMSGLEFSYSTADFENGLFHQDRSYVLEGKLPNLGEARNFHTKDFPIHGRFLGIKIKNTSAAARTPHSITISLKQDGEIEDPVPGPQLVEEYGAIVASIPEAGAYEIKGASSLVMHVEAGAVGDRGFFVEGRTKQNNVYSKLPAIDAKRMLRADTLNETGVFYWNTAGLDFIRISKYSSTDTTKMLAYLTTMKAPDAIEAPVRYRRITPDDMEVTGKFRAIEPLTDITLHANTRLLAQYNGTTGAAENSVFQNGDTRLTGQTLFGPFDRVRITSGAALLVLL